MQQSYGKLSIHGSPGILRRSLFLARATQLWVLDSQVGEQDSWKVRMSNHQHGRFECVKS